MHTFAFKTPNIKHKKAFIVFHTYFFTYILANINGTRNIYDILLSLNIILLILYDIILLIKSKSYNYMLIVQIEI